MAHAHRLSGAASVGATPAEQRRRVLMVAPAWVGDAVMAHAAIRVLAADSPGITVEVVAPAATRPLFERMAEVQATHLLDVGHGELGLGRRWRLARELLASAFDQAIVLPNSWKAALVPALARIPERTGWVGEARRGLLTDARRLDTERLPRMVERFAALARPATGALPEPLPPPLLQQDTAALPALRRRLDLAAVRPVLGLAPGAAFGPAKRWPAAHFAALAATHLDRGGDVWLFGSPADAPLSAAIRDALPGAAPARLVDLVGRTSLAEAVDLLGEVDALVCNDSGLMHVACALERPVVAVYGSTSTAFTPPLGAQVRTLSLELSCAPCFRRECPLGHLRCLRELGPERVQDALDALRAAPTCVS